MPRDEPTYRPRSTSRGGPRPTGSDTGESASDIDSSFLGSPGELQLIVISPENLDAIVEKAQAINQAHHRGMLRASPRERGQLIRDVDEEEVLGAEAIASPNGNCPRCTNNLC